MSKPKNLRIGGDIRVWNWNSMFFPFSFYNTSIHPSVRLDVMWFDEFVMPSHLGRLWYHNNRGLVVIVFICHVDFSWDGLTIACTKEQWCPTNDQLPLSAVACCVYVVVSIGIVLLLCSQVSEVHALAMIKIKALCSNFEQFIFQPHTLPAKW